PDVIIIGAGMAGLWAAMRLMDEGLEVRVFEAHARPGGRIFTLDELPGHPEAGAPSISLGASRALGIAERLGLETERASAEAPLHRWRFAVGGELVTGADWAGASTNRLAPVERKIPPPYLDNHYDTGLARLYPERTSWLTAKANDISMASYLDRKGASEEAKRLITLDLGAEDLHAVSALHHARELAHRRLEPEEERFFPEGAQRLPEAMAAALEDRIAYRQKVFSIEERASKISIRLTNGELYSAPHVISTVPFAALRGIDMRADIGKDMAHLIANTPFAHVTQIHFVAFTNFLEDVPPRLWTDDPALGMVRFGGIDGRSRHIVATLSGSHADFADRRQEAEVLEEAETSLRRLVRDLPEFRARRMVSWQNDPFARGAWPLTGPGQMKILASAIEDNVSRRLLFAGDQLGVSAMGVEGALESAEKAVQAILAS
ncbi:MAG: NAD(P)/FAD-dependent oxidoreductase, partial [Parvularcula sp.]|nr:NAD(P)/FAD-dependent oxidoreductase [Parvularcula sp.]